MDSTNDFFNFIKQGNIDEVKNLADDNKDLLNARNERDVSAVLWAMYMGQKEIAEMLFEKGAELNIYEAAALNKAEVVKEHLEKDKSALEKFSSDGFTPLGLASFFGSLDVMRLLLENGASPDLASNNRMKVAPIHSAVAHRDHKRAFEMTSELVKHDVKVNVAQEGGWTPLHQAAVHGQTDILELLLKNGADTNAVSEDGKTPLQMAVDANCKESIEILQSGD